MIFYLNFARNLPAPWFRKETAILTHQTFLSYRTPPILVHHVFWPCILVQPDLPLAFTESVGRG